MRRGARLAVMVLLVGCGAAHGEDAPAATSESADWPRLCEHTTEEVGGAHGEPAIDCWRDHFPVRACDNPVHPDLVGLWGRHWSRADYFSAELLYDGCFLTISYPSTGHWLCGPGTYAVRSDLGLGEANRTHMRWDGDTMYTVSALHGGEMAWARRVLAPDGRWRLERVRVNGASEPLVRFEPPRCIGPREWDMICARRITPREGEPVPGCEGVPRE